MHSATLITFVFLTGLVGLVTWLITSKQDHESSTGYSLAVLATTLKAAVWLGAVLAAAVPLCGCAQGSKALTWIERSDTRVLSGAPVPDIRLSPSEVEGVKEALWAKYCREMKADPIRPP